MKFIDEVWSAEGAHVKAPDTSVLARVNGPDSEARAALLAAAPQLYRALKEVEWAAGTGQTCPRCYAAFDKHQPGCILFAALQKAECAKRTAP